MTLTILGVLGLILLGVLWPAKADAQRGYLSMTDVVWSGTDCITIWSPSVKINSMDLPTTHCGGRAIWTYWVTPGMRFGGDPVMGAASRIHCNVFIDSRLDYSDGARAGDGTDANCLRVMLDDRQVWA